jgi:2,5-dihydroxypyridine 5,6-dioxygenase
MLSSGALGDLTALARDELTLCGIDAGQSVLVCANPDSQVPIGDACLTAAQLLGAECAELLLPSVSSAAGGQQVTRARRASIAARFAAWPKDVDLLVDATAKGLLHSSLQQDILGAGTRILRVREPADCLARLFPSADVRKMVEESAAVLDAAHELTLTSRHGTEVHLSVGDRPVSTQYGYTDEPGRWDQWGTGLITAAPIEDSARGTLVLWPGDIVFLSATIGRYVTEPVEISLDGGAITRVEGGPEKLIIEDLLVNHADESARHTAHVGWGCDSRADWYALERYRGIGGGGADVRSVEGGVVLAFGANEDLGGTNRTSAHADLAFQGMSVHADGVEVVRGGSLVVAS